MIAPFQAQVGFIPDDHIVYLAGVPFDKGGGKVGEIGKVFFIQIEGCAIFGPRPFRHKTEAGDHGQALAGGVVDHQIMVRPIIAPRTRLGIGPGKVFDNPGRAHFPHHRQRLFDLPRLHLIGQAGVDADLGVAGHDALLWAKGNGIAIGAPKLPAAPTDNRERDE